MVPAKWYKRADCFASAVLTNPSGPHALFAIQDGRPPTALSITDIWWKIPKTPGLQKLMLRSCRKTVNREGLDI